MRLFWLLFLFAEDYTGTAKMKAVNQVGCNLYTPNTYQIERLFAPAPELSECNTLESSSSTKKSYPTSNLVMVKTCTAMAGMVFISRLT